MVSKAAGAIAAGLTSLAASGFHGPCFPFLSAVCAYRQALRRNDAFGEGGSTPPAVCIVAAKTEFPKIIGGV